MKKLPLYLALLSLSFSYNSMAQDKPKEKAPENVPQVYLGGIRPPSKDGKIGMIVTTRAELQVSNKLVVEQKGCKVKSFSVSLLPNGGDFTGPFKVKGAELPDNIKTLIMEKPGKLFLENIVVSCGKDSMHAKPILLKYKD
jgi:hypothetical protein